MTERYSRPRAMSIAQQRRVTPLLRSEIAFVGLQHVPEELTVSKSNVALSRCRDAQTERVEAGS